MISCISFRIFDWFTVTVLFSMWSEKCKSVDLEETLNRTINITLLPKSFSDINLMSLFYTAKVHHIKSRTEKILFIFKLVYNKIERLLQDDKVRLEISFKTWFVKVIKNSAPHPHGKCSQRLVENRFLRAMKVLYCKVNISYTYVILCTWVPCMLAHVYLRHPASHKMKNILY